MTASFTLTLDTHAPVVSWGIPSGTDSGETLTVPYIVDEPGVQSATVTLADNRVIDMVVGAANLQAPLPLDTPQGNATVRAYAVDDVGNAEWYSLVIALTGVIPRTPPPTPQGIPGLRVPLAPVVIHDQTVVHSYESDDEIRTALADNTTLAVRSRWTVGTHTRARSRSRVYVYSGGSLKVSVASGDAASHCWDGQKIIRREGPDAEDELLLLGLL